MPSLTEKQLDFVNFVEQYFWDTGNIPTDDKVKEVLDLENVAYLWESAAVREALKISGVELVKKTKVILNTKQLLVLRMLTNPDDTRSLREKLKEAGVSSAVFQTWCRDKIFMESLSKRVKNAYENVEGDAFLNLISLVREGDLSAIKFYMEVKGIYNPKLTVNIDVNSLLNKVLDVVSRYVPPEIMERIADELEGSSSYASARNIIDTTARELLSGES